MENTNDNLGRKIKQLRIIKNYSQEYMAECLGISQSAYSNIEKKGGTIQHDRLKKIADIFGVSIEEIENIELGVTVNIANNSNKGDINGYVNNLYNQQNKDILLEQTMLNLNQLAKSIEDLVNAIKKEKTT